MTHVDFSIFLRTYCLAMNASSSRDYVRSWLIEMFLRPSVVLKFFADFYIVLGGFYLCTWSFSIFFWSNIVSDVPSFPKGVVVITESNRITPIFTERNWFDPTPWIGDNYNISSEQYYLLRTVEYLIESTLSLNSIVILQFSLKSWNIWRVHLLLEQICEKNKPNITDWVT
jgi:hypothetical protein